MAFVTTSRSKTAHRRARGVSFMDLLLLYRERRALARLDARGLEDIGISPDAAEKEAGRSFWDVPNHWRA